MANDYQKEDARLRLAFVRTRGAKGPGELARAGCSEGDAWRLEIVRDRASGILLEQWLSERITWRKLWRLVTDNPLDTEAQVRASKVRKRGVQKRPEPPIDGIPSGVAD